MMPIRQGEMMSTTARMEATALLKQYVEQGRRTQDEVQQVVKHMRSQMRSDTPLNARPWLSVSLPGSMITACDQSVVFGVMRRVLNDETIREIAKIHPEVWVDGRWYPSDSSGVHLVLVGRLTVQNADGIDPRVLELLDVDADEATIAGQRDEDDAPKFVRMSWRMPRG